MQSPIEFISKNETNKNDTLIIFVHGFTSGSNTWTNSAGQSLPEMLLEETSIREGFDIAYFNYFTKLINSKNASFIRGIIRTICGKTSNTKLNVNIEQLSDLMKSSIEAFCQEYKNIILVSHSMGGLISKKYILNELKEEDESKVKLFLSLAVPHKGSNWADIGRLLQKENPQVIDLQPMSDFLDNVNNGWIQQKKVLPKTIYYYGQYDLIVNEKSAISFQVQDQLKVACNQDHFDITKPESKQSIVYQTIKNNLEDYIKEKMKGEIDLNSSVNETQVLPNDTNSNKNILNEEPIKDRREKVLEEINELFDENERIFKQYGPLSITAQQYPNSELAHMWKEKCIKDIIPNNDMILRIILENKDLISKEKKHIINKYQNHVEGFKMNHLSEYKSGKVPTFPREVLSILDS